MNIISKIFKKINHLVHPALGMIWMLHRVIPEEQRSHLKSNRQLEITPDFLERSILEYKQKGYEFISIDEAYKRLQEMNFMQHPWHFFLHSLLLNLHLRKRFVCVTFDDGYKDNYEIAFPLLKKHEIPFTIYVTTDFVERKANLWWYLLESLGINDEEFEAYRSKVFNTNPRDLRAKFEQYFPGSSSKWDELVENLALDKKALLELSHDSLCTIGCHTVTHPRLDTLTTESQEDEIINSKSYLEQLLGKEIRHFSYPYGFYDNDTISILKRIGFYTAVRTWGGVVRSNISQMELPRIEQKQLD